MKRFHLVFDHRKSLAFLKGQPETYCWSNGPEKVMSSTIKGFEFINTSFEYYKRGTSTIYHNPRVYIKKKKHLME